MHRLTWAVLFLATTLGMAPRAAALTIPTVPVGNAGNADYPYGGITFGAVDHDYRIGKYEVTNAQYAEFLNAKAASDPFELYERQMGLGPTGLQYPYSAIIRSGSDGSYSYATVSGRENWPVGFISYYDALRFANWLHNGQGGGDTETGAYTIGPLLYEGTSYPISGAYITRNADAKWFLPSESEWYKAAYHQNNGPTSDLGVTRRSLCRGAPV